jgi:hypothetical protein
LCGTHVDPFSLHDPVRQTDEKDYRVYRPLILSVKTKGEQRQTSKSSLVIHRRSLAQKRNLNTSRAVSTAERRVM